MRKYQLSAARVAVFATLTLGVVACAPPADTSKIENKLDAMVASQNERFTKLEAVIAKLEKGQKDILAKAAAPAKGARPAEDPNKVHKIDVGKSYSKGPADAPVTIVEWSDFQCPFCSKATAIIDQVVEAYPNDVRFVYKNYPLPFHKEAMPAAKAAIAAGKQGKFFEMHDLLFANYRTLSTENYEKWAGEIGLDVEQFKTDMASPEVAAAVTEEMKQAGTVGVRGTPTFFINGKKPAGRSFELWKSMIDEEIKKKKA